MLSKLKLYTGVIFLFFITISCVGNSVCSPAAAATADTAERGDIKRNDPPFFRFTTPTGREIYILGSPHFIPLSELLEPTVLVEIERLAEAHAILYTEHEVANEMGLAYLANPENRFPEESLGVGINFFSALSMSREAGELGHSPENLLLGLGDRRSDVPLLEVAKAEVWLGAVILGTHAGILSYDHIGGTEHELLYGRLKDHWRAKLYLETVEQAIHFLKACSVKEIDDRHNRRWAKGSIEKILKIKKDREGAIAEIKDENLEYIKRYSWELIKEGSAATLPHSCIKRNQLWIEVIASMLSESASDTTPLFIVVGTGHLAGFGSGCSFIRLLMERLGVKILQRFRNTGEWITTIALT